MQRAHDLLSTAVAVIQRLSHRDAHVARRLLTLVSPTSETVKRSCTSSCDNSFMAEAVTVVQAAVCSKLKVDPKIWDSRLS